MFESAALPFGREDTPAPLREGFAVLRDVLAPATAADPGRYAELGWATLHGLATLARAGRLPPEGAADRRALAVDLLAPRAPDRDPATDRSVPARFPHTEVDHPGDPAALSRDRTSR